MRGSSEGWSDGPPAGGPQFALPRPTSAVKLLLKVNFGVFLAIFLVGFIGPGVRDFVYEHFSMQPSQFRSGLPPIWQLLTYGFLHDPTSYGHILWNMLQLYFFGTLLEGIVGERRFLVTYFLALLAGIVLQLLVALVTGTSNPVIGASGAVLGIVVAAAVLRPDTTVLLLFFPVPLKWLAIGIVAIDVFTLGTSIQAGGGSTGVAHWVHLGGAAYGFFAARLGWIWRDPIQRIEAKRAIAREESRQRNEERVDQLLKKIHDEGLQSLSSREREFLKKVSDRD